MKVLCEKSVYVNNYTMFYFCSKVIEFWQYSWYLCVFEVLDWDEALQLQAPSSYKTLATLVASTSLASKVRNSYLLNISLALHSGRGGLTVFYTQRANYQRVTNMKICIPSNLL